MAKPSPDCARVRALTLVALSALMTLMAGCGGGGGGGTGSATDGPCGESTRKQWVLNVAREWYLFPDLLPASTDIAAYSTAEDLLDALTATARAQGKDRFFSYLTTKSAEDSFLGEGQFVGFGFRSRTDAGNRPFVLDVFEGSPAATAGLQRGDEVIAVDQGSGFVSVAQSLADGSTTFTDLLGAADAGVQRGLQVLRNGQILEMQLSKRTVTIDPVPDSFGTRVLPMTGTTGVGYLNLRSHIGTADPRLDMPPALAALNSSNLYVQELAVKGLIEKNREYIYQALQVDPLTASLLSLGLGFKAELSGRDNALLAAMLQDKNVPSSAIKVVSERAVVYLMGRVTPAEGEAAARVASRVSGVQRVVKNFDYLTEAEAAAEAAKAAPAKQ